MQISKNVIQGSLTIRYYKKKKQKWDQHLCRPNNRIAISSKNEYIIITIIIKLNCTSVVSPYWWAMTIQWPRVFDAFPEAGTKEHPDGGIGTKALWSHRQGLFVDEVVSLCVQVVVKAALQERHCKYPFNILHNIL